MVIEYTGFLFMLVFMMSDMDHSHSEIPFRAPLLMYLNINWFVIALDPRRRQPINMSCGY